MADWCDAREISSVREEKLYKEAWLHAELCAHEVTCEKRWAFVALRNPEWRPPYKVIQFALWRRIYPD